MACLGEGVIVCVFSLAMSNLDMIFKVPLSGGGLILLLFCCCFFSIGTKHRVQSPLERWPSMISMNRPKMGSRPYEFLLHSPLLMLLVSVNKHHSLRYIAL